MLPAPHSRHNESVRTIAGENDIFDDCCNLSLQGTSRGLMKTMLLMTVVDPSNGSRCPRAGKDDCWRSLEQNSVSSLVKMTLSMSVVDPTTKTGVRGLVKMALFVSVVDPSDGSVCTRAGEDDALSEVSRTDQHQAVQQLLSQHDEGLSGTPR